MEYNESGQYLGYDGLDDVRAKGFDGVESRKWFTLVL